MKILITGGLGFLGGRIATILFEKGHEICLGTRRNMSPPTWLPEAKMRITDWQSDVSLRESCFDVDLIIHAAGMNAKDCELNPSEAVNANKQRTSRLLEAAISNRVKTFFYISSIHVYSSPLQGSIDENTLLTNPHPYAISHRESENQVAIVRKKKLLNSTILRLTNAYGAPVSPEANCWQLIVNDLCMQAVMTRQLILNESSMTQRNFITMGDVCTVISGLVDKLENQTLPQVLNIGNTHSNSLFEMAELIQKRCKIIFGFSPKITVNSKDSDKISKFLDFKSLYSNLYEDLRIDDRNYEIDELLNFCKNSFANN